MFKLIMTINYFDLNNEKKYCMSKYRKYCSENAIQNNKIMSNYLDEQTMKRNNYSTEKVEKFLQKCLMIILMLFFEQ